MRYFPNDEDRRTIKVEFAKFSASSDEFGNYDSLQDRGQMEPHHWWAFHGADAPMLQGLALKLLGQPSSSSCCERNWSTYSFIHSLKRNNLKPKRAEDLVFIHSNLRLLSRRLDEYKKGESLMWDIGADRFDSLEGPGLLEIAELSLDEPALEATLFDDVDVETLSN